MICELLKGHECAETNNNKIIVVKENKCEYVLKNSLQKEICKLKVDGCYIRDGKRCDFALFNCDDNIAFFIELKGSAILQAIDQIDNTITVMTHELNGFKINARIVLTKVNVPDLRNNPKILRFERRLKKLGGNLKKETIRFIESS